MWQILMKNYKILYEKIVIFKTGKSRSWCDLTEILQCITLYPFSQWMSLHIRYWLTKFLSNNKKFVANNIQTCRTGIICDAVNVVHNYMTRYEFKYFFKWNWSPSWSHEMESTPAIKIWTCNSTWWVHKARLVLRLNFTIQFQHHSCSDGYPMSLAIILNNV